MATTTLDAQARDISAYWSTAAVWPAPTREQAFTDLATLARAAAALGSAELTTIDPTQLRVWLARKVGAANINAGMTTAQRDHANRLRNTLTAATTTLAILRDQSPGELKSALAAVPKVQPRTGQATGNGNWSSSTRPAHDDEVACLRLTIDFQLGLPSGPTLGTKALTSYLLADAGITNIEAAFTSRESLDDTRQPTTVDVTGHDHRAERTVSLDRWQARALAGILANADQLEAAAGLSREASSSLVYTPRRHGADNAAVTVCNAIRNIIERSGLHAPDLKPNGLSNWAPAALVRQGRYDAAAAVSGLEIRRLAMLAPATQRAPKGSE